jgi:hypothetical protein
LNPRGRVREAVEQAPARGLFVLVVDAVDQAVGSADHADRRRRCRERRRRHPRQQVAVDVIRREAGRDASHIEQLAVVVRAGSDDFEEETRVVEELIARDDAHRPAGGVRDHRALADGADGGAEGQAARREPSPELVAGRGVRHECRRP